MAQGTVETVANRDATTGRFGPGNLANPGGRPSLPPEVKARLAELGPQAVNVIADLLRHKNPQIRQRAAETILDRWLGKPTQALEHGGELADALTALVERVTMQRNGHGDG